VIFTPIAAADADAQSLIRPRCQRAADYRRRPPFSGDIFEMPRVYHSERH